MNDLEFLDKVSGDLINIYTQLSESNGIEKPRLSDQHQFRHANQDASLLVFLKGVRLGSLLRAALILLRVGHT